MSQKQTQYLIDFIVNKHQDRLNSYQTTEFRKFIIERSKDYSLEEIYNVLEDKIKLHPLTVVSGKWFPKLFKETKMKERISNLPNSIPNATRTTN